MRQGGIDASVALLSPYGGLLLRDAAPLQDLSWWRDACRMPARNRLSNRFVDRVVAAWERHRRERGQPLVATAINME